MVPPHEVGPVPGASPPLAAHIARQGNASVVRVRGSLSGWRVPFLEILIQRLEKRGDARVTIDLREISAIDSAGAAMLRRAAERMLRSERSLTVLEREGTATPAPALGAPVDG